MFPLITKYSRGEGGGGAGRTGHTLKPRLSTRHKRKWYRDFPHDDGLRHCRHPWWWWRGVFADVVVADADAEICIIVMVMARSTTRATDPAAIAANGSDATTTSASQSQSTSTLMSKWWQAYLRSFRFPCEQQRVYWLTREIGDS